MRISHKITHYDDAIDIGTQHKTHYRAKRTLPTAALRQEALDLHNEQRRMEGASNMRIMVR